MYCKGHIGSVGNAKTDNRILIVRRYRLVRVDPRYLISICLGATHDQNNNIIPHSHMSNVGTVENAITARILPVELRSLRRGQLLNELCPHARNLLDIPALTPIVREFLSIHSTPHVVSVVNENTTRSSSENFTTIPKSVVKKVKVVKSYSKAQQPKDKKVEASVECVHSHTEEDIHKNVVSSDSQLKTDPSTPQVASNQSFADYLREQPSTSQSVYTRAVEREISARKRVKLESSAAAVTEHNYSQNVSPESCFFIFVCLPLVYVLSVCVVFFLFCF